MVDGGSRGASGQLDDWAAGVAADLDQGEGDRSEARRRPARDASPGPDARKVTTVTNKKRLASDRDSSPEEEDEEQAQKGSLKADGTRPKLPRPDKKEPCPRCNSMDTKFCYYNNYNIKQPRFYCKTCQRYWTAGGTLRNIAPGSGRRKSKSKAAREKNSPSLAEQLTAAAVGQGMFGLGGGGGYNGISPALALAAAGDHTSALLAANSAAAYGLGGHGTIAGLKLGGVGGLPAQFNSELALREHLAGQHSLETRLLLNGHLSAEDLPNGMSAAALAQASAQLHALHGQGSGIAQSLAGGHGHTGSPSPSPPPAGNGGQQHPLSSSPQHGAGSQASQQPSPPQQGSDDAEGGGDERYVAQARRVRVKAELEANAVSSSLALGGGGGGSGSYPNGASIASSIANAQLAASLNMPPSMGALAAVMGPGGGPSGLHPLLAQDNGGSLLDAGLTRQQLLVLQQHQAMQQAQQQESLQQLSSLQQLQGLAALHGQHSAAGLAALDPLQRSALLHSAAGLGGVGMGSWLQGGGGGNPLAAAAALESLQAQHLLQAQQVHPSAAAALIGSGGSSAAAQMLQAQAAAAAGGGNGWQGVTSAANWPSAWSSYNGPSSGSYAGYALQAAAAYSGAR